MKFSKIILFLFFTFSTTGVFAQQFDLIKPSNFNNSILVGPSSVNFKLRITAQNSNVNGNYKFFASTSGLYLNSAGTSSLKIVLAPLPSDRSYFSFQVNSLNPGEFDEIDFTFSAGNCFIFPGGNNQQ